MKTKLHLFALLLVALAFLLLPVFAFAQEGAALVIDSAGNVSADALVQVLTPFLVPLILAVAKKYAPSIPASSLPLVAPVLGVVMGLVQHWASGHEQNLWVAAGLGLLGVAVRELKEAIVPAPNGGWPTKSERKR